jgi:AcrR family transcriptional regulator
VLLRCSFYAEHSPEQIHPDLIADGVAAVVHRTFAGPVDGVNVVRGRTGQAPAPTPVPPTADDPQTLRPRGERTRTRLLGAAATVIPVTGYQDLRVDDIVDAAGVSHGTFYRYFDNRDDYFRVLSEAASTRLVDLVEQLDLGATADELRTWVEAWFDAYDHDGGVLSTWPEMHTRTALDGLARAAGTAIYSRLAAALGGRDFGRPAVDGTTLFALLERLPYSVINLGFMRRQDAVDTVVTTIRRGFLGLAA